MPCWRSKRRRQNASVQQMHRRRSKESWAAGHRKGVKRPLTERLMIYLVIGLFPDAHRIPWIPSWARTIPWNLQRLAKDAGRTNEAICRQDGPRPIKHKRASRFGLSSLLHLISVWRWDWDPGTQGPIYGFGVGVIARVKSSPTNTWRKDLPGSQKICYSRLQVFGWCTTAALRISRISFPSILQAETNTLVRPKIG